MSFALNNLRRLGTGLASAARVCVLAPAPTAAASALRPSLLLQVTARRSVNTSSLSSLRASEASTRTRQLVVGGVAAVGVVGLGLAGAAMVRDASAMGAAAGSSEQVWPKYMQARISDTFTAFGSGLAVTAASAVAFYRSGAMNVMARNPLLTLFGGLAASVLTLTMTQSIPIENKAAKYLSLFAFNATIGFSICPLLTLGGAVLARAAAITGGMVGSLSLVAANSPSDKFLWMAGPLSMALGGLVIAQLGAAFFPATRAAMMIHNISLYGGLALFSGFVLYDTSRIVEHARTKPQGRFDAVSESISIYLDAVNIFVRVAQIVASGGSSNKRR